MFDTIMWATDGSAHADKALPFVKELASKHGSKVIAAHVAETFSAHQAAGLPVHPDEEELKAKVRARRGSCPVLASTPRRCCCRCARRTPPTRLLTPLKRLGPT